MCVVVFGFAGATDAQPCCWSKSLSESAQLACGGSVGTARNFVELMRHASQSRMDHCGAVRPRQVAASLVGGSATCDPTHWESCGASGGVSRGRWSQGLQVSPTLHRAAEVSGDQAVVQGRTHAVCTRGVLWTEAGDELWVAGPGLAKHPFGEAVAGVVAATFLAPGKGTGQVSQVVFAPRAPRRPAWTAPTCGAVALRL